VVVRRGLEVVAVSRGRDGSLRAVSAACTHLGCVVAWNGAEESWDCPCHGSRFSPDGEVLHGPAVAPLERKEL
jgi:Rieske Fe-S protein